MSSTNSNMVSPKKKPLNKKTTGKKPTTKKKVVAATSVSSPIVKAASKKEVVPKKIMKTTGSSAPSKTVSIVASDSKKVEPKKEIAKPVIKQVASTKKGTTKKVNATTNKSKSTVAKDVNKVTASAVKTTTKAQKGAGAVKSTTKAVVSAATVKASTKTGTTATNITKSAKNTTKGVAKAATTVNKKTVTKKKNLVNSEEDLNKQIDKYINNVGIPSVVTSENKENTINEIEDVVENDYSLTREYKDLASELRKAAEEEEKRKLEETIRLTEEQVREIEKSVEEELLKNTQQVVKIDELKEDKTIDVNVDTIEIPVVKQESKVELEETLSKPLTREDVSSYQDKEEAKKDEYFGTTSIPIIKDKDLKEKKNKFGILKFIKWLFAVILLGISGLFGYTATVSNYFPSKYIYILIGALVVINLFVMFLLKRKHKVFNFMGIFLSVLFTVVLYYGYGYMNNTFNVLKDLLTTQEVKTKYYYLVLSDSNYNNPLDLADKNIGLLETGSDKLIEQINVSMNASFIKYDTPNNMISSLQLHETEGFVLSETLYELLKEQKKENNENIEDDVKIIGTVEVVGKPEEVISSIEPNQSFIVYISGLDTRGNGGVSEYGLSDVNMLAVVNPKAHKILFVNIPRDYYVQLHGTEGKLKDKLTHAGLYGVDMSMKTLQDLFNIKINAFVKVNFQTVTTLVDDIDGIDVYSDISFDSFHMPGWRVPQGKSHMDGAKALAFARERYAYSSGDRHRGQNQQQVMTAIIDKVSTNKKYLLQYDKILADIQPYIATNIEESDIQELVKEQLNTMPSWNIESISVNGSNGQNATYSWPSQVSYVMLPDQNTIDVAKLKMIEVMNS